MRQKSIYVECGKCHARWAACSVPIEAGKFVEALRGIACPHCKAASKDIFMCDTTGPRAVKRARGPRKEIG